MGNAEIVGVAGPVSVVDPHGAAGPDQSGHPTQPVSGSEGTVVVAGLQIDIGAAVSMV